MNRRQKLKKLKHYNEFLLRIINNTPEMKCLYQAYNEPVNVVRSTMRFQEYRAMTYLPTDIPCDDDVIELYKIELARKLFEKFRENVNFRVEMDGHMGMDGQYPILEASVFIGCK